MQQVSIELPIKVVMFGSGPYLTHDARQFLVRLENHPDIQFLAAICQSQSQTIQAIFKDLWKRRGILAFPLFLAWIAGGFKRNMFDRRREAALNEEMTALSDRIYFVTDIHAPEVLAQIEALKPDLGLIYGSPILKPKLFEIPAKGTLGIHHGKVPQYRGNKTMFWAIYNGEEAAGVTIQKVNAGLDTGSIVKEGEVRIGRRSRSAVWQELEALGLDLYIKAILDVKAGTAEYQAQTGPKGKLYRNPKPMDLINFLVKQMKRRLDKA
jgi:folate-dependent phosphoribosylglycinamide formyltransferase PurN